MKRVIICSALLLACATTRSAQASAIRESDGRDLASCRFIGTYSGYSNISGTMSSTGIENAKNEVLEQAASHGATHVVWQAMGSGWGSTVAANAYRCEKP
ncbi:MAG TPA: hypothetical protein VML50_05910 [Anaeromyxobacter sp.]|nr:hypothetical protein [Anaeromyxobacter sp.]